MGLMGGSTYSAGGSLVPYCALWGDSTKTKGGGGGWLWGAKPILKRKEKLFASMNFQTPQQYYITKTHIYYIIICICENEWLRFTKILHIYWLGNEK